MGAGGATCFASGFLESETEGTGGADLQARLIEAAGDMPILGPNCYGLLNYLDNVTLWPDQHGGRACEKGVAIIGQSSNVLINMTMQKRGLPIAYTIAAGNQAQTQLSDIASYLLDDERVTAIGLYIEGFGDIRKLEAMATKARKLGKPIVAIKTGKSEKSKLATLTHTASLAGGATASSALMERLGIVEVNAIAVFLETLKLLHVCGALEGNAISSMSCSGGEAGLIADMAEDTNIQLRDISPQSTKTLKNILGPIVTVANPLDYHTFIWGDEEKMAGVYSAVFQDNFDLNILIMDIPPQDRCGAVALHLKNPNDVEEAAQKMEGITGFLIEEMIPNPIAEVLIGITRDATGLMLLTIGSGGVMTELLDDTASVIIPSTRADIKKAIGKLKLSKLLLGYRGKPKADMEALLDTIEAVQHYCLNTSNLIELDINPLMALKKSAIAVDALIKLEKTQ